jgi:hypothetical protein
MNGGKAFTSGPYMDFADFYSKYLMWVGGKTPGLEGPRR